MTTMTSRRPVGIIESAAEEDWRQHSLCAMPGQHPDLWFAVGFSPAALAQTAEAQRICRSCPVMETCLRWALETGQEEGVWGGLTGPERRKLRGRRKVVASPLRKTAYAVGRCLDRQEEIEGRLADGASLRQVAREIGEGKETLVRALKVMAREREEFALDDASQAVDAA